MMLCEAIARWPLIETGLIRLLILVLDAKAEPAHAILSALYSGRAQIDAIAAAAKSVLEGDNLTAFLAVTRIFQTQARTRNKLVHQMWGESPEVPDALLLTDPDVDTSRFLSLQTFLREMANHKPGTENPELLKLLDKTMPDKSKIFMYKKKDFEVINRDFEETSQIIHLTEFLFRTGRFGFPSRDEVLRKLSGLRLYREAIESFQSGSQNSP